MDKKKEFHHLVEGVDFDFYYEGRPCKGYSIYLGPVHDYRKGTLYKYQFLVEDVITGEILFRSFPYTGTVGPDRE